MPTLKGAWAAMFAIWLAMPGVGCCFCVWSLCIFGVCCAAMYTASDVEFCLFPRCSNLHSLHLMKRVDIAEFAGTPESVTLDASSLGTEPIACWPARWCLTLDGTGQLADRQTPRSRLRPIKRWRKRTVYLTTPSLAPGV